MYRSSIPCCQIVKGLADIQYQYLGYLIDAWGVLHDGENLYPYALDCLANLEIQRKKVIILSNAARRSHSIVEELHRRKIEPEHYHAVISSGELAWHTIQNSLHSSSFYGNCGYYLGPQRSRGLTEGLDLEWVDDVEQADFILNTGAPVGNPTTTVDCDELLSKAALKNIPMICANPDLVAIRAGQAGICAGALAKRYEEMGANRIEYHGKPWPPVYTKALALLDMPTSQVLAIGDAFETDILGASNAGLDTCLIASGIHRQNLLPLSIESVQSVAPLNALPKYASEFLAW